MSTERPTRDERAAAIEHDPLTCYQCLNPDIYGDQAPSAEEIEILRLRAEVAELRRQLKVWTDPTSATPTPSRPR